MKTEFVRVGECDEVEDLNMGSVSCLGDGKNCIEECKRKCTRN